MKRRLVSMVLALSLLFSLSSTAFAVNDNDEGEILFLQKDQFGTTKITYQSDESGNQIFSQYLNNKLIVENTLRVNDPDVIYRLEYNYNIDGDTKSVLSDEPSVVSSTFRSSDIITETSKQDYPSYDLFRTYNLGNDTYRNHLEGSSAPIYGLDVSYTKNSPIQTIYEVDSYVGILVDLIAGAASALKLPSRIVDTFLKRLLVSLSISISGGKITEPFTGIFSAKKQKYIMRLENISDREHTEIVAGYLYTLNDEEHPDFMGTEYLEGYVPQDWGNHDFGVALHEVMFPASSYYEIVSWE